ncbi:hypothetical protein EZV62_006933 [Acer yangbiense]|uniref:Transposase MuDR plant domain-containing protein n=1 Tax=Acer yangbiense TaxID=1000413 RepID=A0A5C7I969_9ROSI|nr:hypothetical protein EZV62_006933 [Acer yangbiense]
MLPIRVLVKYVDRVVDMDVIKPRDCSVISLINDTMKVLNGQPVDIWETWQLRITYPWNGQQHVLTSDKELMLCFEFFNHHDLDIIEFELILVPNDVHFPEDDPAMLCFNDPVEENKGDEVEENKADQVEEDNVVLVEQNSEEENVGEESEDESDVSLVDEYGDKDYGNKYYCQPDGDDTAVVMSSNEETALARIARYCQLHQWAPNPNGTISFEAGQILGNVKFTREVIKRYDIQEGFTLKKIKNDRYRYTVTCKNDACDWRLHASCLTDKVTFMIRNLKGGHSMCPRVAENKEATSRWVASVLGNVIGSNPNGNAKSLKNELQERFAVKVDTQTIYRAKKIVLENLKSHHVEAYAKLRKYGNAIQSYNPGTDVLVAMNPEVESDNPTFL